MYTLFNSAPKHYRVCSWLSTYARTKNHNKQCTRYSKRPEDLRLRSSERKKNAIQLDIDSYKNEIYFICYYSVNMCTGPQGNGKKKDATPRIWYYCMYTLFNSAPKHYRVCSWLSTYARTKNHNKQCTRYSKRPEDLRLRSSERKKNAIQLDIDSYKNEIYFICYYSVNMCTGPQGNGKKGRHTENRESNNIYI